MTDSSRKILLKNLPYVIIGMFASIVSIEFDWLPLHPVLVGILSAVILRSVVFLRGLNGKKYRKNIEYGSARWGNAKDIKPYIDPKPENNVILTASESLTMNSRPKPVKYARNKNIMVIGGAGSGKTQFFVKPNLMQSQSKDFPVSFVVTDPKGSLVHETANLLQRNGYRIKIFNTIDFSKSMKYNPFEYIRSERGILKFVTALIANTQDEGKSSNDPFWQKAEILLFQALIGYIFYECEPDDQNMNSLVEMINMMEVREDNESFQNAVDFTFEALEERDPNHFALRQYRKFKLSAGVINSKGHLSKMNKNKAVSAYSVIKSLLAVVVLMKIFKSLRKSSPIGSKYSIISREQKYFFLTPYQMPFPTAI